MLRDCVDLDALEWNAQRAMRPESRGSRHRSRRRDHRQGERAGLAAARVGRGCCATSSRSTPARACSAPGRTCRSWSRRLGGSPSHAEGERATARGAAAAGALYVMSTSGTTSVEDVAKERGQERGFGPQWFQLYMSPIARRPARCSTAGVKAGFKALVLTRRTGARLEPRAARTPVIASENRSVNMVGQPIAKTAYDPDRKGLAMFPTNFKDLEWLVQRCAMPVVVKGVLRGDDARRCVDCGVKGHHGVVQRRRTRHPTPR